MAMSGAAQVVKALEDEGIRDALTAVDDARATGPAPSTGTRRSRG